MATTGFIYKRVKADWHMLRVGTQAAFFGRTRREVFEKANAWIGGPAAGMVAA